MRKTKAMIFNLEEHELCENLIRAEKSLIKSPKIKFERTLSWRKQCFKSISGIIKIIFLFKFNTKC